MNSCRVRRAAFVAFVVSFAVLVMLAYVEPAGAQLGPDPGDDGDDGGGEGGLIGEIERGTEKVGEIYATIRTVLYFGGVIALIGVGLGALTSRFNAKWFWLVLTGLAVIALSDLVISFFVDYSGPGHDGGGFRS